ncbi:glucanotransferase domain of glycogen debranching enzyme-domain-containing protein [Polychytrium aggregatum]|uniref:glucanotransferase domain of glycogen debranching enzyme-domain-containing protein n=1 Tax=Polychytrium aggregatum TaxID=110093 RepID=UPI0022FDCF0A|nr:glucanotransferase domain of glycogen debranching enzyme-domain-containing protein [Polychytrium aggregatum]KAI9204547.1 glucanotransferase domain of glycogen debranching enzyme-domain-containing protein [Polychytrium aggregatum]
MHKILLPLDGIVILTVIPKWLPTISRWPAFFERFSEMGYNMVHFAPLNTRGISNSPYAIYDQLSLSADMFDDELPEDDREQVLAYFLDKIRNEYSILSVTDVVWNHTACNSPWLEEHPEAGYNLKTAPHLRPAYELDEALMKFSANLAPVYDLSPDLRTEEQLAQIMNVFKTKVLPGVRLWEFYVVDVANSVSELVNAWPKSEESNYGPYADTNTHNLSLKDKAEVLRRDALCDPKNGLRFSKILQVDRVIPFLQKWCRDHGKHISNNPPVKEYESILNEINLIYYQECDSDVASIDEQVTTRARYLRVQDHGPRLGPISRENPLVDTYFTRLPVNSKTQTLHPDEMKLANNGWIWNADPLVNFAGPNSKAYLRREVIAWGDCVKLRYGSRPEDNPWLWEHQAAYTRKMARLFDGFRIDNCHSTPIEVGSYLLDVARQVRPDLYVFAELFTGSEEKDIHFVSKLGINSLIREAMSAWNVAELSRLVHRYGGEPIGSFTVPPEYLPLDMIGHEINSDLFKPLTDQDLIVSVKGSTPHALFMDCTHDNDTPHQKRTAEDSLPNAAVVAMSTCAVGSVKGYDELVPELLNVVHETRKYRVPDAGEGIIPAKSILSILHTKMAREGYSEIHVHQENDFITVHRVHPITHDGYFLIARSAFQRGNQSPAQHSKIVLANQSVRVVESASLKTPEAGSGVNLASLSLRRRSRTFGMITGLPSTLDFSASISQFAHASEEQNGYKNDFNTVITVDPERFVPGSIVLFRTWLWFTSDVSSWPPGLFEATQDLDIEEINVVLYRAAQEEVDTIGDGVYDVPGYGPFAYCGLQGFVSSLLPALRNNDLGHPINNNLRSGHWMMDYISHRLDKYLTYYPKLKLIKNWLAERFGLIRQITNSLVPKYFALVVLLAYQGLRYTAIAKASKAIQFACPDLSTRRVSSLETLAQSLIMTTYQLYGSVKSTGLYPYIYPTRTKSFPDGLKAACLAAGLPHFSTHHMRCWGRDVFISIPGLLLTTGHFLEAKDHLIGFGSTLRHGLIPNLLDQGLRPRYNARDAVWWWLYCVQRYCQMAPEGLEFLGTVVARRFPPKKRYRSDDPSAFLKASLGDSDDDGDQYTELQDPRTYKYKSTIAELCHEILERHANGIHFTEWNAGPNLDHAMTSEGFNISISTHFDDPIHTGLIFGGNRYNCGSWMDKMGDSEKAGTKGLPATPRDGCDVEIAGLLKATLRWVSSEVLTHAPHHWKWPGFEVTRGQKSFQISYSDWNQMIQKSFEKSFYVPLDPKDDPKYDIQRPELVNRRGIYKDTVGSSIPFMDYQLRPNMFVAMAVAPELFTDTYARNALDIALKALNGPCGMKTLDPADWNYRGHYDNGNDSADPKVAHGYNYHQGPEWVWIMGYFLRAHVQFSSASSEEVARTLALIQKTLYVHKLHILETQTARFVGLPELTNAEGEHCFGSCETQAWSSATFLELIADLVRIANK